MGYRFGSNLINYEELAEWAKNRKGEVIFCEGENGDYLDFKPLIDLKGVAGKTSKEVVYLQNCKNVQHTELSLF